MAIRRTGSQTLVNRGVAAAAATPVNIITGSGGTGATVNISSIQIANSTFVAKDDLAIDTAGGYLIINGTGFQSGAVVYIQGTAATSTSFVSSSRLNVTVPALSSGLLDVYVVNTDGSGSIYLRSLNANGVPSWTTTSPLTSQDSGTFFGINLVASGAAGDGTITYAVSSGSTLPSGTSLASNGYFYGTVSGLTSETTYSFSVDAIDTQNQETARSFNITVRAGDANFTRTTLLINGETSNNTWITDVSTNNFAITVNGDTRPVAFSPYETVWSNYFDGTGDYLTVPNNSVFNLGSVDFTVEGWVNMTSFVAGGSPTYGLNTIFAIGDSDASTDFRVFISKSSTLPAYATEGLTVAVNSSVIASGAYTWQSNKWYHIAVTRTGGNIRIFIDGSLISTTAYSSTIPNPTTYGPSIGATVYRGSPLYTLNGYISNLRIVKGTAVYTSAFTSPTSALTAITNTSLLTCQSNRLIDNSTNAFTITKNGDVSVSNFGPFVETDTTTGSGYFDGTGDYLTFPNSSSFAFGTGAFTIEFWIHAPSNNDKFILGGRTAIGTMHITTGGSGSTVGVLRYVGSSTIVSTNVITDSQWHHCAIVRDGSNNITLYVDGISRGTGTDSTNYTTTSGDWKIGSNDSFVGSNILTGYLSNLRILKGTALYTSTFTPPASPLTAIANTSFLSLQSRIGENNNRIVDLSGLATPISRNGNLTQGTFSPYQRGGWSNYFDGTGDYLSAPSNAAFEILGGSFTIECWIYLTASQKDAGIVSKHNGSTGYILRLDTTFIRFFSTAATADRTYSFSPFTWYHVAVVSNGTTGTIYVNGVAQGATFSTNGTQDTGSTLQIGRTHTITNDFPGYISNLRILKGTAVYTSAFTTPTLPLTAVANTSLLTCADSGFIDKSPNNFAITRNGDVSVQPFSPFKVYSYTPITHSVYFDGTGDYLTVPDNSSLESFTDFTVEFWVYFNSISGTQVVVDKGWNGSTFSPYLIFHTNGAMVAYASSSGSWDVLSGASFGTLNAGQWYHIALSRSGSTIRLFRDGSIITTVTSGLTLMNSASALGIGGGPSAGANPMNGYVSNLRIVSGVAVYTGNFAVPNVGPLQLSGTLSANAYSSTTNVNTTFAAANTSLLTCASNTIIDLSTANTNSLAHTITVNGDAQATTINPLGFTVANSSGTSADYSITNEGGSMFFDGNGDFLKLDTTNILTWSGTTTFTVEGWFYQTAFDATSGFMNNVLGDLTPNSNFGDALYWSIGMNNSNQPGIRWYGGPTTCNATEALTLYRWNHVAWVVSSGVLSIYINGKKATLSGTSTLTAAASSMSYVVVGADRGKYYSGYMSGLRVLKGTALYTSGFVPPAAPPLPIAGSSLLINGTNGSIIDYTRKNNLETVGDVKIRNNITKFGNTSMYFDGTGDYLYTPPASINDLVGDFTVEAWIYRAATGTTHSIVNIGDYIGASGILFYVTSGNALAIYTNNSLAMSGGTVSATTWTHVALVRSGTGSGNLKLYLNGTNVGTPVTNNSTFSGRLYVGIDFYNGGTATNFMDGYIDDLRITKGVARYTSNFTAPSGPFQTN